MIGISAYFWRRNSDTEEYFVGNRSFSGWVVGLSMLGTIVSSSTFLALPAAAYALDWRQLVVNLSLPFVAVLSVLVFIPLFRRGRATSAFEYLGHRYGTLPRLYGTFSFIVMQTIRAAQVLFLMALPVQFFTGVSLDLAIIGAGVFVGLYTIVGGIDAVIWTDVIQTLVLMAGGIICLATVASELPGGFGQIMDIAQQEHKFSLGSFDWDFGQRTFWTVFLLGVVNWLAIYGGDQNMVQRYLAAKSTREARKATVLFSTIALPMWTGFFFVGTSVFAYYQVFPSAEVAALQSDQVLPYFILHQLPAGLAGLIVTAIVAAAMSTLDSSINAISAVSCVDIFKPFAFPGRSDRFYLWLARLTAVVASVLMICGALLFRHMPKESMNDVSLIVTSIFGGCLMGLFMLGFFTERVNGRSVVVALFAAMALNIYLGLGAVGLLSESLAFNLHSYWIGPIVNLVFISLAYILSWFIDSTPHAETLNGLTVWTMNVQREQIS
jgi:SSS family solute:Na+ symporter